MRNKIVVILGPTVSGKTNLSIKLAKKFNGEVISADSRQVYKGLDIGAGKITKKEMQGIPHHLLDVANLKRKFTVAQFQKLALKAIKKIQKKGKIPFLVGGTGFYIQSIVDDIKIPEVKPDWKLRKKLEKKSTEELYKTLLTLDPERAKTIDRKNPRRLIRTIEIILKTGKSTSLVYGHPKSVYEYRTSKKLNSFQIGIKKSPDQLKRAINQRLQKRLKMGMVAEVEKLHKSGLSWRRLEELGLEYRFVAQYLQNKLTRKGMVEILEKEIWHFAKRQMTWFKRDKRIKWIKNYKEAKKLIKKFLS